MASSFVMTSLKEGKGEREMGSYAKEGSARVLPHHDRQCSENNVCLMGEGAFPPMHVYIVSVIVWRRGRDPCAHGVTSLLGNHRSSFIPL